MVPIPLRTLPTKTKSVLSIADALKCLQPNGSQIDLDIYDEYFAGLPISAAFGGLSGFSRFWKEGSNEMKRPWLVYVLPEEDTLKIVIDPVSLPCKK